MPYANNKGADQPAHPVSVINAFVVRCLDSIIPLVSISESLSLYQAAVAVQAGLSLPLSETPKICFLMTRLIYTKLVGVTMTLLASYKGLAWYIGASSRENLSLVRLKPACADTEAR